MANPVLGKSLCSDWFFLGQDFAVRTVSMETVQFVYFCFGAKPANSTFATKTAKKKCENCRSSHWNYQQKLKRLKFFRCLEMDEEDKHFLSARHRKCILLSGTECHNYNKLLTNWACSGRTGEYWSSVVFVQTSLRWVRTVTTSSQYSPVQPSRSVSKRLLLSIIIIGSWLMCFCWVMGVWGRLQVITREGWEPSRRATRASWVLRSVPLCTHNSMDAC